MMKLSMVKEILNAGVAVGADALEREVRSACGSDLMSDVLAFSKEKVLLLTGLINPQVIRTAEMMDSKAVVILRGKEPTAEVLTLAEEKRITVMTTEYSMYTACGLLYEKGLGRDDG